MHALESSRIDIRYLPIDSELPSLQRNIRRNGIKCFPTPRVEYTVCIALKLGVLRMHIESWSRVNATPRPRPYRFQLFGNVHRSECSSRECVPPNILHGFRQIHRGNAITPVLWIILCPDNSKNVSVLIGHGGWQVQMSCLGGFHAKIRKG